MVKRPWHEEYYNRADNFAEICTCISCATQDKSCLQFRNFWLSDSVTTTIQDDILWGKELFKVEVICLEGKREDVGQKTLATMNELKQEKHEDWNKTVQSLP